MKKAVTCAQCGTKMRAGIKFCSKCGYRLRDPEAEALAEAAQAQEAAANLLTEEEIAAIRAAEVASEAEEVAATVTSSEGADEALTLPARDDAATVEQEKRVVLAEKEAALAKQSVKAEIDAAKRDAMTEVTIAKVESDIVSCRQESEATARTDAVRLEMMEADAKAKAVKTASLSAAKLSKMQIAEDARAAKRITDAEVARLNAEAKAAKDASDAAAAIAKKQVVESEKAAKRITDAEKRRLDSEAKAAKRLAAQKKKNFDAGAAVDARDASRDSRAEMRVIESRAFGSRVADFKQDREHALAKKREKEILRTERRVVAGKEEDFRTETRDARAIAKGLRTEEKKEAKYRRAEAEVPVLEKRAENRLYQKRVESDKRVRKRREADMQRVAAKQAAIRERETKRLGAVQYKAASIGMTADAAEAHRLANQAECEMQKRMHEDKIAANEVKAEKKLIRLRAGDLQKHSRTKVALREKETRALGRAELRALRVVKTEEALEAHRRADEVMLEADEKQRDAKRYQMKLAADRRLVKTRAADADKLQREEIAAQEKLHEAKNLEESRASRMRTDDSERAVQVQKNQTKLYSEKRTAADKLAEREHKLEMRMVKLVAARDEKIMTMKEKEQQSNAKLAARYEKDALKRAKKISKISGAPVSLVPALSGEAPSHALLTSVDSPDSTPIPTLRDPDSLLAKSYESNEEQYRAYKKARKKKDKGLRFVEIGVRNDKKYFDTLYEGGEVMVAKRNVYIARAQAVIAIFLMIVALAGSLLPMLSLKPEATVSEFFTGAVLDNQDIISIESLLMNDPTYAKGAIEYVKAFMDKLAGGNIVNSLLGGLKAFSGVATPLKAAFSGDLTGFGALLILLLLTLGMILTPVVIIINLLIALLRVIFRIGGRSVAITRVMRNLRCSYTMLGFYIVPFLLGIAKPMIGFAVYVGSFALVVVLNLVLNLCKKYEKGDRKFVRVVHISGVVRLAVLVAFLYVMLTMTKLFGVTAIGATGFVKILALIFLLCSYIFTVFSSRAVTAFGFEILGYTKAQSNRHGLLVIFGALAGLLGGGAAFLGKLSPAANTMMCFVGAGIMAGLVVVTLIFGLIKMIIEKRHSMLEPIVHALGEGYPLK